MAKLRSVSLFEVAFFGTTFFGAIIFGATSVYAGTIVPCGADECTRAFSISVDGHQAGGGQLIYDADTGDIRLDTVNNVTGRGVSTGNGLMWSMKDGSHITLNSLYGNADPILGFGLGVSTGSAAHTFAFAFDLPISVAGNIEAKSSVSYSLTAMTNAGAQIAPTFGGKIVNANDVDTSIGGLAPLDKEVAVGDAFYFTVGPATQNSPVYTADSIIVGSTDYDLMSVLVSFSLSANSAVGISGFVSQTELAVSQVPLPAALPLLMFALGGLGAARRLSKKR